MKQTDRAKIDFFLVICENFQAETKGYTYTKDGRRFGYDDEGNLTSIWSQKNGWKRVDGVPTQKLVRHYEVKV